MSKSGRHFEINVYIRELIILSWAGVIYSFDCMGFISTQVKMKEGHLSLGYRMTQESF
jgi:hypothetical protein